MTEAELWHATKLGDANAREQLAISHYGLVHHVVLKTCKKLRGVPREFAVSAATVGLMQAIDSFDPGRGLKFSTFAASRIRGSIIDAIRQEDYLGRRSRQKVTELQATRDKLYHSLDREPSVRDIAVALQVTERDVDERQRCQQFVTPGSLEDAWNVSAQDRAFEAMENQDEVEYLLRSANLTSREREMVESIFYGNLSNVELGRRWGLTESRVSQIYKKVMQKLRTAYDR